MKIGFWATSNEKFFVSHTKGLNEQQIAVLHSLNVGDRLKLWKNDLDGNMPNYSLQVLVEKEGNTSALQTEENRSRVQGGNEVRAA